MVHNQIRPCIWQRLTRVVCVLIVFAGAAVVVVSFLPEIARNEDERKQIHLLEAAVQYEKAVQKKLRNQLDGLTGDSKALERLAREHGYSKPGETVIWIKSPSPRSDQ